LIDQVYKDGYIETSFNRTYKFYQNEYIILKDNVGVQKSAITRCKKDKLCLIRTTNGYNISGVRPRNKEQSMALDALTDPSITVTALTGIAGSGKSLLCLAAALNAIETGTQKRIILTKPMSWVGKHGLGYLPGPQPLEAKILTPTGWTTMGNIKVGDEVIAGNGEVAIVEGVYPKGIKDTYIVHTTDGTCTKCCIDHLWYTQTAEERKRNKLGRIRTTGEIKETLYKEKIYGYHQSKANHRLPRNGAAQFKKQEISIPPYLLGALLGDGSFSHNVSFSNTDEEILQRVSNELASLDCDIVSPLDTAKINYSISRLENAYTKTGPPVRVTNLLTGKTAIYPRIGVAIQETRFSRNNINYACNSGQPKENYLFEFVSLESRWTNPVKRELDNLGLLFCNALSKFIPDIYIYNDIETRLEVLRGLMDTDGSVKENGESSFCTISKALAEGVQSIVRSLGGRTTLCTRDRRNQESEHETCKIKSKHIIYEFTVSLPEKYNPFFTRRKYNRYNQKFIHGSWIDKVEYSKKAEVQCIKISHPSHLYITNDYIVTHNTSAEKFEPYLECYMCNIEHLVKGSGKKKSVRHILDQYDIEFIPLQLIRGASWANAFIICDEAQPLNAMEIETLGTRVGDGSKIAILGDLNQRDEDIAKDKTGLYRLVNSSIAKDSELIASIELIKCERSPTSALFSEIFEKGRV